MLKFAAFELRRHVPQAVNTTGDLRCLSVWRETNKAPTLWLHGELNGATGSFIIQLVEVCAMTHPGTRGPNSRFGIACFGHVDNTHRALLHGMWQEKFLDAADIDLGNPNLIRGLNLSADPVSFDNERIDLSPVRGAIKDIIISLHGDDLLHNQCVDRRALRLFIAAKCAAFVCSRLAHGQLSACRFLTLVAEYVTNDANLIIPPSIWGTLTHEAAAGRCATAPH